MFFSVFAQVKDLGSSTCLIKQSEDTSLRNSQNNIYYAYCDCGERIKENHEATTSIAPGADGGLGLLICTCKKCWHRIQLFAVNPHIIIGKNIVVDDLTEIDAYLKNLRTVN